MIFQFNKSWFPLLLQGALPCFLLMALSVQAGQFGNFLYLRIGEQIEITEYLGEATTVEVPATIEALPVTSIGAECFTDRSDLANVFLPTGLKNIGAFSFYNCSGLSGIELPGSVTNIGEYAFCWCSGLSSIELPRSLTLLSDYAFDGCSSLTFVQFPDNLEMIGAASFYGCFSLSNVVLPNTLKSIGRSAFFGCSGMTNILFTESLVALPDYAFYGCAGLTSVNLPRELKSLGKFTFGKCSNLSQCIIPDGITTIMAGSFGSCRSLKEVILPSSIQTLGGGVFAGCSLLDNVVLPTNIVVIPLATFADCTNLKDLTMPTSVKSIGDYAFYNCSMLSSSNLQFNGVTNVGFYSFAHCTSLSSITLPKGLQYIGMNPFNECSNLTYVYFEGSAPKSTYSFGSFAPSSCIIVCWQDSTGWTNKFMGLPVYRRTADYPFLYQIVSNTITLARYTGDSPSVDIPTVIGDRKIAQVLSTFLVVTPSVTNITVSPASEYFSDRDGVLFNKAQKQLLIFPSGREGSYAVPDGTESLATLAFAHCAGLEMLEIPDTVKEVSANAFDGCDSLTNFAVQISNPSFCDRDGVLFTLDGQVLVQFPPGRGGTYTFPEEVRSVRDSAFQNSAKLTQVDFNSKLLNIGNAAFKSCDSLNYAYVPNNVTNLGKEAFSDCGGLTAVTLGDSIKNLQDSTFLNCTNLGVFIHGSLTNYGAQAFKNCRALSFVDLGPAALSVGNYAFYNCYTITNIILGSNLLIIGDSAFSYCRKLTSLSLDSTLKTIGYSPWSYCASLREVSVNIEQLAKTDWGFEWYCTQINIGSSTRYISPGLFAGFSSLATISVDTNNPVLSASDGVLFNKDGSQLIAYPTARSNNYTVPERVTSIGPSAFYRCSGLSTINLNTNLLYIGENAFTYCTSLAQLRIPDSVTRIGAKAFSHCDSLVSVVIGKNLAVFGNSAFASCSQLTGMYFNGPVPTYQESSIFANDTLLTVYYREENIGWPAFYAGRPTAIWKLDYIAWADQYGLLVNYPQFSGESDDADHDGMTNLQEKNAGTNPVDGKSALIFETSARTNDLSADDLLPYSEDKFSIFLQTIPQKSYCLYCTDSLAHSWIRLATITASNTQKRFLVQKTFSSLFFHATLSDETETNEPTVNPAPQLLAWIPAGKFMMGSPTTELKRNVNEGPQTDVTVANGFWMSKFEVSQALYQSIMGVNPSWHTGNSNLPVEMVSWQNATIFCARFTASENSAGRLPAGYAYRLPTEAEWEFACRAGTVTATGFGNFLNSSQANFDGKSPYNAEAGPNVGATQPIGSYMPNAWGLYDMHGNVWEWCQDWYDGTLISGAAIDPKGPVDGEQKVLKGGCWNSPGMDCRSATRCGYWPNSGHFDIGFRIVLAPAF